ncbi:MAG: metalloregulator ArsR/SmtB family transcription factor [Candidatus Lokiarchaeota archaeon]|nr:metalloregulator ArsR/SmtB family transcription factor [Candidatus Lokiarchaeota archaeon]
MDRNRQIEIKEMLCNCKGCINGQEYFENLQSLGKKLPYQTDFKKKLDFFNALGNEDRLKIFEILKEKDRCVCELEAALDKSQPSISHHLRILESAGLIRGWKKGKFTYYGIEKDKFLDYLEILNRDFDFHTLK